MNGSVSDTKQVLTVVGLLAQLAEELTRLPELHPIARRLLEPVLHSNGLNGGSPDSLPQSDPPPTELHPTRRKTSVDGAEPVARKRRARMSAEQRKRLRISAKKRWAEAKRAGRNTLGGSA